MNVIPSSTGNLLTMLSDDGLQCPDWKTRSDGVPTFSKRCFLPFPRFASFQVSHGWSQVKHWFEIWTLCVRGSFPNPREPEENEELDRCELEIT